MRRTLTLVLTALVAVPLAASIWLGTRVVRDQRELRTDRMDDLLEARLDDVDALIARVLEDRRQDLRAGLGEAGSDVRAIRRLPRDVPSVQQTFLRDSAGAWVHPSPGGPLSEEEREFIRRTRVLWLDSDSMSHPTEGNAAPFTGEAIAAGEDGWYSWFWDSGLQLLYWRRLADGHVAGAELGRIQLLADVVAALPATDPTDESQRHDRIVLLDARGTPVYQWGSYEPPPGGTARLERQLSPPLGAWTLRYHVSDSGIAAATTSSTTLGLTAGLLALVLVVAGLGLYLHRESSREIRDATLRVGFVNQVSHELKTPLTNIRMYAELMEQGLDTEDHRARRHVRIIVAESQRLSRLIANVLTFARQRRDAVVVRPAEGCLDATIEEVLTQFRPSLEREGVRVAFDRGAPEALRFDADIVTQVVGNLVSNVEKYAARGGVLDVTTGIEGRLATVEVSDRGPGIPTASVRRIFRPFVRLDDAITEGATGAGIGLALARELARLHGGDLELRPVERGACFAFTFRTGPDDEEGP